VLPTLTTGALPLALSCLVMGAFTPGIVPLVLGRIHAFASGDFARQRTLWTGSATAFALFQALAAYGLSFLFAQGAGYGTLFATGAGALVLALVLDLLAGMTGPSAAFSPPPAVQTSSARPAA
jgi:hypothetical protein